MYVHVLRDSERGAGVGVCGSKMVFSASRNY